MNISDILIGKPEVVVDWEDLRLNGRAILK